MHWTHECMSVSRDKIRDNYLRLVYTKFFFIVGWLRNVLLIPNNIDTRKHVCQWNGLLGSFVCLCFGGHCFLALKFFWLFARRNFQRKSYDDNGRKEKKKKEMVFIVKKKNSSFLVFDKWHEVGWHMTFSYRRDWNDLIHLAMQPYEGATMMMKLMG